MKIFTLLLCFSCAVAQADLAKDIYDQEEGNVFFSPFSLNSALSIVYAGARGETAEEMAKVLYFDKDTGEKTRVLTQHLLSGSSIQISNSLWIQEGYPILPSFLKQVKDVFTVDYRYDDARKQINTYVENATNGMIQDLMQEVATDTKAVVVNTIYFKSAWKNPFNPDETYPQPFYLEDGSSKDVSMMHSSDFYFVKKGDGYTLLELPYAQERCGLLNLVCYIVLPDEGSNVGDIDFNGMSKKLVHLTLPKFSMETTLPVKEKLENLGLQLPFSCMADFSGINGSDDLYISNIIQKAKINFEENGTEASAATAVTMNVKSVPDRSDPVTFTADRPFQFLIVDKRSQTILFMGRLAKP